MDGFQIKGTDVVVVIIVVVVTIVVAVVIEEGNEVIVGIDAKIA